MDKDKSNPVADAPATTPGPWIHYQDPDTDERFVVANRRRGMERLIATLPDDDEANGSLLAAAPDLLAALDSLAEEARGFIDGEVTVAALGDCIHAAEAAIRTAKGGS